MHGYLDVENADTDRTVHASGANLRTTLTRLLAVGGERTSVFGFGERVTSIRAMGQAEMLDRLFSQAFYNERDTRTEEVLALVRGDSQRSRVHLIVTDGRRGSGNAAIAQYQRMGEVASWWTAGGGVFSVAASLAPFQQVPGDSTGCTQSAPASRGHCPLYVFAFAPASATERTLAILDDLSARLYAYPPPSDGAVRTEYIVKSKAGNGSVAGIRQKPFVLGFRAQAAQNEPVSADLALTFHADQSSARFALDDSLVWALEHAALRRRDLQWTEAGDASDDRIQPGLLRTGPGSTLVLPVKARSFVGLLPTIYRVRILSTGKPNWIREYEAVQHGDSLRTYGLATLFTQLQTRPAMLTEAFVTVY